MVKSEEIMLGCGADDGCGIEGGAGGAGGAIVGRLDSALALAVSRAASDGSRPIAVGGEPSGMPGGELSAPSCIVRSILDGGAMMEVVGTGRGASAIGGWLTGIGRLADAMAFGGGPAIIEAFWIPGKVGSGPLAAAETPGGAPSGMACPLRFMGGAARGCCAPAVGEAGGNDPDAMPGGSDRGVALSGARIVAAMRS